MMLAATTKSGSGDGRQLEPMIELGTERKRSVRGATPRARALAVRWPAGRRGASKCRDRRPPSAQVCCADPPRRCRTMPSDEQISSQIEQLEHERESLFKREGAEDPSRATDAGRLEEIRVDLDRLWDLLRQRRALRDAGQDPNLANERAAETVERYWQ
jgi:hypothetical protein